MEYLKTFEDVEFEKEDISGEQRGKIKLEDNDDILYRFYRWGDSELKFDNKTDKFNVVNRNIWDYEVGSYIDHELIIKRNSDGKFFNFIVQETRDDNHYFRECEEVFPQNKTITEYK